MPVVSWYFLGVWINLLVSRAEVLPVGLNLVGLVRWGILKGAKSMLKSRLKIVSGLLLSLVIACSTPAMAGEFVTGFAGGHVPMVAGSGVMPIEPAGNVEKVTDNLETGEYGKVSTCKTTVTSASASGPGGGNRPGNDGKNILVSIGGGNESLTSPGGGSADSSLSSVCPGCDYAYAAPRREGIRRISY